MGKVFVAGATALIAILLGSTAGAAPKIVEFNAPDAIETQPVGIDTKGDIAGYYIDHDDSGHGFVRSKNGEYVVFPNGDYAVKPLVMNVRAQTTGPAFASDGFARGFLGAKDGSYTVFAAGGANTYTVGTAIGPTGEIAGYWARTNDVRHGFVRGTKGAIKQFDCDTGDIFDSRQGTYPSVVTPRGEIYGTCIGTNWVSRGFHRTKQGKIKVIDLPEAGSGNFQGTTLGFLNSNGTLAGTYVGPDDKQYAFLRPAGGETISFVPPDMGQGSIVVTGLNSHDVVVGYFSDVHTAVFYGFVRDSDGTITVIDSPSAGSQPSEGTLAQSVNDKGVVAGYYMNVNGGGGFLRKP